MGRIFVDPELGPCTVSSLADPILLAPVTGNLTPGLCLAPGYHHALTYYDLSSRSNTSSAPEVAHWVCALPPHPMPVTPVPVAASAMPAGNVPSEFCAPNPPPIVPRPIFPGPRPLGLLWLLFFPRRSLGLGSGLFPCPLGHFSGCSCSPFAPFLCPPPIPWLFGNTFRSRISLSCRRLQRVPSPPFPVPSPHPPAPFYPRRTHTRLHQVPLPPSPPLPPLTSTT